MESFTASEQVMLKRLTALYDHWGYRTGKDGDHEAFEAETHFFCPALQPYTDVVFRNLQQFDQGRTKVLLESDVYSKLAQIVNLELFPKQAEQANRIIGNYFYNDDIRNLFCKLAETKTDPTKNSIPFICIVTVANAICDIAIGKYAAAYKLVQTVNPLVKLTGTQ